MKKVIGFKILQKSIGDHYELNVVEVYFSAFRWFRFKTVAKKYIVYEYSPGKYWIYDSVSIKSPEYNIQMALIDFVEKGINVLVVTRK